MVGYELRKLLGNRLLQIALAILLILNCLIAYFTADSSFEHAISDAQKDFLDYYLTHTEEVEAHAAEIEAFEEEQRMLEMEAMNLGIDFERQKYPDIYKVDALTDAQLISWARSTVNSAGSYASDLETVIERAENNLAELESKGYSDSYSASYQRKVIEEYRNLLDSGRKIGLEADHGWDSYYTFTQGDIFLFAFVLLAASTLFLQEKQCGFWQIIRSARHGRLATGISKLAALAITVTVALLLFSGTSFAIFGLLCGYSSPDNVLQVLNSFRLSTLQLTVGQYLPIHLLLKWSALLVFGVAVVLLSLFFTHTAEACAGGLLIFGSQYLLQAFPYLDADNPFRNLNLLTVSEGVRLTARYRTLSIFGSAQPALLCWALLSILLVIAFATLALLLYAKGYLAFDRPSLLVRLLPKSRPKLKRFKRLQRHSVKGSVHSLFAWECYKRLISDRTVIVLVLLLAVNCVYAFEDADKPLSYSDTIYHEYMNLYAGEWTQEKSDAIAAEAAFIEETVGNAELMSSAYQEGTLSEGEYAAYLESLDYAQARYGIFDRVVEKDAYLRQTNETQGITPSFVYDSGWNALLCAESDLWLYAALLLLLSGIFSSEYAGAPSGTFAPILRTTRRGRASTYRAKLLIAVVGSSLLTIVFTAVKLLSVALRYELPALSAPIVSLEALAALQPSLSIGQYLALYLTTKLVGALLLCLLIFGLSALFRKTLPTMSLTLALTLLPNLLVRAGLPLESLDFHTYFAATPFWLATCEGGLEWVILVVGALLTLTLNVAMYRRNS